MIFCSECGTKNYDTAKFCRKCGASMIFNEDEEIEDEIQEEIETPAPTITRATPPSPDTKKEPKERKEPVKPVTKPVVMEEAEPEEDEEEYDEEEEYVVEEEPEEDEEEYEDDYEEDDVEESVTVKNVNTPVSETINPANSSYWDDVVPEIEEEIYRIPKDIILKFVFGCVAVLLLIIILIYCVNSI